MKLTINNFGALKKPTTLQTASLTIFCGANNTGKTHALYLLYALMDPRLGKKINGEQLKKAIPQFFATETNFAQESTLEIQWDADKTYPTRTFLLPAERTGINLFFRELNARRAALMRAATLPNVDTLEILKDIAISRYPQPISDYIDFLNSQPEIKRQTSEFADIAAALQKDVLRVKYKIDRYGDISISPLRSGVETGLHMASSTVKTFFGLWSYLNHLAQVGDWLMIDEPELNLHPSNQRAVAQILARLVNRGVHVIISTHSDYMVRELGNLVMLGEDFEGRQALMTRHGYSAEQLLQPAQVAAYEFDAGTALPMAVSLESGIQTRLFDQSIEAQNDAAQAIYFARQDIQRLANEPNTERRVKAAHE